MTLKACDGLTKCISAKVVLNICTVTQINRRRKVWQNKICFKIKYEGQGQSSSKLIGILIVLRCISSPSLEILRIWKDLQRKTLFHYLTWICGDLSRYIWHWKARLINPKSNRDLNQHIFCPNFVVLAWRGDESSYAQARDWHMDTHTDVDNDNTLRLKPSWTA